MVHFSETPTLRSSTVTLEPLSLAHVDELTTAVRDGELWKAWFTFVPTPEGMRADVERRIAEQLAGACAPWAIRRNDSGEICGMTCLLNLAPEHRRVEIGATWLARSAQGAGINPAVKLMLLGHAFETLGCNVVELRTHWHNQQSRAAIARLGAKQDGVLRNHMIMPDGTLRDTVVFSIIASEWPAVRAGLEYRLGLPHAQ